VKGTRILVLLAFAAFLQFGRVYVVDPYLRSLRAPGWAFWASAIAVLVLWLTLGNIFYRLLAPKEKRGPRR